MIAFIINFVSGIPEIFSSLAFVSLEFFIESSNIFLLFFTTVPIMIYNNTDLNKDKIILDNKNKTGVYQFINLLTGKSYVGSSTNLSIRFRKYYNYNYISNPARDKSIICSSLLKNGYPNFKKWLLQF